MSNPIPMAQEPVIGYKLEILRNSQLLGGVLVQPFTYTVSLQFQAGGLFEPFMQVASSEAFMAVAAVIQLPGRLVVDSVTGTLGKVSP
jgi:hypothetical protein